MVCTNKGVSVGRANYYTEVIARDDYYKEGGEAPGRWYGAGAEALGVLDHEIGHKDKSLNDLMLGKDPFTGEKLRNVSLKVREQKEQNPATEREKTKKIEPKLAWDLSFSVPKSVSVLWSAADDETRAKIEAAQRKAVEAAIEALEEKVSFTRTGKGGSNKEPLKVAFAAFDHTTSRALDPHLHTHVLLVNTGLREDGRGGAVDASELFKTGVHVFGALHTNALQHELHKLGLETYERKLEKGKTFEIRGVPKALLEESSKRRKAILSSVREKEAELGRKLNSFENDEVFRKTRDTKRGVDKEALRLVWQEQARSHGFDYTKLIGQRQEKQWTAKEKKEFLQNFTRAISYKERINEKELLKTALYYSKGELSHEAIRGFINTYKSTHLQKTKIDEKKGQLYTLNTIGLEAASRTLSRYDKFRFVVNREVSRFRRWRYQLRTRAFERKQRAFKRKITFLYAIGRVDRKTYKRLVHEQGLPKTRAGIEWEYATHQISAKYRDKLLRQIDPKVQKAREEREANIQRWERETEEKREERMRRVERVKQYLTPHQVKALTSGLLSLPAVERNLERQGLLVGDKAIPNHQETKEERDFEKERIAELKTKGLISRETETALITGEIAVEEIEKYLYRHGHIKNLPALTTAEREKRSIGVPEEREARSKEIVEERKEAQEVRKSEKLQGIKEYEYPKHMLRRELENIAESARQTKGEWDKKNKEAMDQRLSEFRSNRLEQETSREQERQQAEERREQEREEERQRERALEWEDDFSL